MHWEIRYPIFHDFSSECSTLTCVCLHFVLVIISFFIRTYGFSTLSPLISHALKHVINSEKPLSSSSSTSLYLHLHLADTLYGFDILSKREKDDLEILCIFNICCEEIKWHSTNKYSKMSSNHSICTTLLYITSMFN